VDCAETPTAILSQPAVGFKLQRFRFTFAGRGGICYNAHTVWRPAVNYFGAVRDLRRTEVVLRNMSEQRRIRELFEIVRRDHTFNLPLHETRIEELERQIGYKLPADLKEFYKLCNGATLFEDWSYRFVPLDEMRRVRIDILGVDEDWPDAPTDSWYSICDVQDGNDIAADLASVRGTFCWILNCFHEEFPFVAIIALSFTEFLGRALKSRREHFWLEEGFKRHGYLLGRSAQT
jgi:cell wall assembly regulator SMI1